MSEAALRRLEETYPPIVSTAMVAEILGLNVRTVLLMAQDGRLAASRIPGSRSYRFFLADVVRMLDENRLVPGSVEVEEITGGEVDAEPVAVVNPSARRRRAERGGNDPPPAPAGRGRGRRRST